MNGHPRRSCFVTPAVRDAVFQQADAMTSASVVGVEAEPAHPRGARPQGLVSVLVPCCGQLEYTKLCVPSLLRHTAPPYELVFLDIGSLDGTAEYLAGVAAAAPVRVELVRTATDLGIPAACQEALARARGEFLVLLNNDTLMTADWLKYLVGLAGLDPSIALVGPMSNYAALPQLVEMVPYRLGPKKGLRPSADGIIADRVIDVDAVDRFARDWREQHRGQWMEVDRLGGFCLLIKREVLIRLGPLETSSGLGLFDTDALCRKAREAGYTLACCRDLFIHNFGSRTFAHGGPAAPDG
jgi:GT2 family glycosyltransferase